MTEQRVSYRYARALIDTAIKSGMSDKLIPDFKTIQNDISATRELKVFINSPIIQSQGKIKVIREIFKDKISSEALNFLIFLIDKGRSYLIDDVIVQYMKLYNLLNNRLPVDIISAVILSEDLKAKIIGKISDYTKKTILPKFSTDSKLKGGILVQIDDWVFDATLKNQLSALYKKFTEVY